jgi:putative addiction module component (TIGR02574 family)
MRSPLGVNACVAYPPSVVDIGLMGTTRTDIAQLSPAERLRLVEELWDSLTPADIPLTPAQAEELDHREARHRAAPGRGRPWREVLDEIEHRRG